MDVLGIDIGGTGMKAAVVDVVDGVVVSERHRIPTPKSAKPKDMAKVVVQLREHFNWKGLIGVSFPTVIVNGKSVATGNLHKSWKNVQVDSLFSKYLDGATVYVGNDADLAGLAEITFGAGRNDFGTTLMLTIGTGIGSGLFYNGRLVPNIEIGRIQSKFKKPIEYYYSDTAKKREGWSVEQWAKRFDKFLHVSFDLVSPDHIILGGGRSKDFEDFEKYFTVDTRISPAKYRNKAGIVGAAVFAYKNVVG